MLNIESLTRWWPFWKGRGVLANSSFLRPRIPGTRLAILNEGMPIYIFDNDYISRMIQFFGDFDPCLTRLIRSLVQPGDFVIDIGANLGVISLPLAKRVGAEGLVYAFEPQTFVCDLLEKSVRLNTLTNVCIVPIALSRHDGYGYVESSERSLGTAQLKLSSSDSKSVSCVISRLDSLNLKVDSRRVRLIKIDVEGHEADVLSGACSFINLHKPEYILFESHPIRGKFEAREEVQLLRSLGYSLFSIRRSLFQWPRLKHIRQSSVREQNSSEFLAKRTQV